MDRILLRSSHATTPGEKYGKKRQQGNALAAFMLRIVTSPMAHVKRARTVHEKSAVSQSEPYVSAGAAGVVKLRPMSLMTTSFFAREGPSATRSCAIDAVTSA
jgi:hypothetical protein